MKRTIWVSVAAIVAVTLLVIAGARALLIDDATPPAGDGVVEKQSAPVTGRPDCPEGAIGGVDLACLGGEATGAQQEITVANVWAWWCEPCRAELPVVEEFARAHPEYTVVGVHADRDGARGAALLEDLGVDLPSFEDDSNVFAGTLGLPPVVPLTVVFRGEEKIGVFAKEFTSAEELAEAVRGVL